MLRSIPLLAVTSLLCSCGVAELEVSADDRVDYPSEGEFEAEPFGAEFGALEQGLVTCDPRTMTAYQNGRAYIRSP